MTRLMAQRREAILIAMNEVEGIAGLADIDRGTLVQIEKILARLAARDELFRAEDFPPPEDPERDSNMYELWRDARDAVTLYASVAPPGLETPPHNHGTWAAIAGIRGVESNDFYRRALSGDLEKSHTIEVRRGSVIGMLAGEVHSIRILPTPEPFFSLHLYGLPFERTRREYRDATTGSWVAFTARPNIRRYRLQD